jgi:hypothetical protein
MPAPLLLREGGPRNPPGLGGEFRVDAALYRRSRGAGIGLCGSDRLGHNTLSLHWSLWLLSSFLAERMAKLLLEHGLLPRISQTFRGAKVSRVRIGS